MKLKSILLAKNDRLVNVVLALFFGLYWSIRWLSRIKFQGNDGWHFVPGDAIVLAILLLIIANPKGIKLWMSSVFVFLNVSLVNAEFIDNKWSGVPKSFIFHDLIYLLDLNISLTFSYFVHQLIYVIIPLWMFWKRTSWNQLIDDTDV